MSLAQKPQLFEEMRKGKKDIRITSRSYFPNGTSASDSSSCVCQKENLSPTIHIRTRLCHGPLPQFMCFRNTMTSRPFTQRGFSVYACKVRLIPWTSAKMTMSAHLPPGCMKMRFRMPKRRKSGQMSALRVDSQMWYNRCQGLHVRGLLV